MNTLGKALLGTTLLSLSVTGMGGATNPQPSPGTYGNATHVGQFTVSAQGKITGASNVAIQFPAQATSLPPSGPAQGDLTGTYPAPSIGAGAVDGGKLADGAVTAAKIGSGAAAAGHILSADGAGGAQWAPPVGEAIARLDPDPLPLSPILPPDNAVTDIAVIENLPAGTYTIAAKLTVGSADHSAVRCELSVQDNGGLSILDTALVTLPPPVFPLPSYATIPLLAVRANPGSIHLGCGRLGGEVSRQNVSLVAARVGALTCSGDGCQNPEP